MPAIALSLINVTKRYGATAILDGLSLGLFQGEKVGLIGRNGAGKSTLFRLLTGDETPDSGEVVITQGLRVARLSQEPHFAPGATIRQALEAALADHRPPAGAAPGDPRDPPRGHRSRRRPGCLTNCKAWSTSSSAGAGTSSRASRRPPPPGA